MMNKLPPLQDCSLEIDVDTSELPGDPIHDWKGLTLNQCKNLAASTDLGGQYWTYKQEEGQCIVKSSSWRQEKAAHSGIVSGARCGVAQPGNAFV